MSGGVDESVVMTVIESWKRSDIEERAFQFEKAYKDFLLPSRSGPDLIKLFWRSVTLLQKFTPIREEWSGHMTFLNQ